MATLDAVLSRVRLELGDNASQFTYTFTGNGSTKDFYVEHKPLDPYTLVVTRTVGATTTTLAKPADYTVEANLGVIHFTTAPASNATIKVTGQHYRYFTDDDLTIFINTALTQHTANRTDNYGRALTLSLIPPVEEYPMALAASIEALWALATDAAFDINITAPDGVVIPRSQRFAQLSNIINQRQEQYRTLCALLNIGLYRVEVGVLRRTSRTTNKLVPVYMPQEIEDSRRPERVYLPIDMQGRTVQPSTAQPYDIVLMQGDSWSGTFDFPFDLTGYTAKAQIRTYPNSPSLYGTFTITYTDVVNGILTLTLERSDTAYLPARSFWDLQLTAPGDDAWEQTYIKGLVFADQQVTLD